MKLLTRMKVAVMVAAVLTAGVCFADYDFGWDLFDSSSVFYLPVGEEVHIIVPGLHNYDGDSISGYYDVDSISGLPLGLEFNNGSYCGYYTFSYGCTSGIDTISGAAKKAGTYKVTFYATDYMAEYKGGGPTTAKVTRTIVVRSGSGDGDGGSSPSLGVFAAAQTFNGWLTGDGFAGTIQVKTTKATANRKTGVVTSKATATVSVVGGKKQTFSGNLEIDEDGTYGYLEVEKNGRYLYVEMSSDGLNGEYLDDEYGYDIQGVRDLFASTDADDKAYVSEVLAHWKKTVRCAWQSETDYESSFDGYNTMTFTVGAKGKTKVAGTLVDGTKFSVASQMIIGGDGSCYVPVIVSKKGVSLSFNLILSEDGFSNCRGEGVEADGLDAEYIRFGTSTEIVDDTLTVEVDTGAYLWDLVGGEEGYVYSDLLPDGLEISVKNSKLTVPKAGKVVMDRYGEIDYDKAGDNPSGLKLSYKAKDGTFTGSFKAYVDNNGRLKTVTVSVSGLIIDGIGYGTATVKKVGSVPFRLLGLTYAEWCTIAVATDGIGVNSSGL